jgi:hypothetical protein
MECTTGKKICVFLKEGSRDCKAIEACHPATPDCETANLGNPCGKILENSGGKYCAAYAFPETKWVKGKKCPLRQERKVDEEKKAINPLKASKKAAKGQAKS